ncbi:MAG: hypothetical protein V3S33_07735 [Gammaproteobacteria bacterium]
MKSITQSARSCLAATMGLAMMLTFPGSAGAYEVWVSNQAHDTGTQVLDDDLNILATIPGTNEHTHMGDFTSDYSTFYSSNLGEAAFTAGSSSVDAIDADSRTIVGTAYTAGRSHAVVVSEDDRFAYSNNLNDNTDVIDTTSNTIVNNIAIGDGPGGTFDKPVCIGMSANSKTIYHAAAVTNKLFVLTVDNTTGTQTAAQTTISGIVNACGLLRSKSGDRMYVIAGVRAGDPLANMFHVVDIASNTVVFSTHTTGLDPHAIAETSNGKEIWIGNRNSGTLEIRDGRSATYDVIDVIDLADPKHGLGGGLHKIDLFGFSPNNKAVAGVLRAPDSLAITIDVKTRTVVDSVYLGGDPHGLRIRH